MAGQTTSPWPHSHAIPHFSPINTTSTNARRRNSPALSEPANRKPRNSHHKFIDPLTTGTNSSKPLHSQTHSPVACNRSSAARIANTGTHSVFRNWGGAWLEFSFQLTSGTATEFLADKMGKREHAIGSSDRGLLLLLFRGQGSMCMR